MNIHYPPVNKHSNGKSPFSIGNTSSNGGLSIAMLDYRRVIINPTNSLVAMPAMFVNQAWSRMRLATQLPCIAA